MMMNLRDEIAEAITSEIGVDIDFTIQGQHDAADAIIAKVREALLSWSAVESAIDAYWSDAGPPRDRGDMESAITAALDAVTTD